MVWCGVRGAKGICFDCTSPMPPYVMSLLPPSPLSLTSRTPPPPSRLASIVASQGKKSLLIGRVYECVGRGVASGGRRIRSRCCYLLLRFVKAMGGAGDGHIICKALSMVLGEFQQGAFGGGGRERERRNHDFFARYQRHCKAGRVTLAQPWTHSVPAGSTSWEIELLG